MSEDVLEEEELTGSTSTNPKQIPWKRHTLSTLLICFLARNLLQKPPHFLTDYASTIQSNENSLYEILCTTERRRMTSGSYNIRCRDFKRIAELCAKTVRVHLFSHSELIFKPNVTNNTDGWKKDFNATVSVKIGLAPKPRFGKVFMDVVDRYTYMPGDTLDPQVQVIVQSKYHAQDQFPDQTYHVLEHWYNSFPKDMWSNRDQPAFDVPTIQAVSNLQMATVWTNPKQDCPSLSIRNNSDVFYDCINEKFGIEKWYEKYFKAVNKDRTNESYATLSSNTTAVEWTRLQSLLKDPNQGPGRIYYELFWKYDVLIVPAKTSLPAKLRYGNVQRAISQMRSGVPVLLEIYGEVLEDFMATYNYTCVYESSHDELKPKAKVSKKSKLPPQKISTFHSRYRTLDEVVVAMKTTPDLRKQCQKEGLLIANDYAPARLVERELRILGYDGEFRCPMMEEFS